MLVLEQTHNITNQSDQQEAMFHTFIQEVLRLKYKNKSSKLIRRLVRSS